MENIVFEERFPENLYEPVEVKPQDEGENAKRYIYKRIKSEPEFLIYHESLRCPPPQTKESIIAEINAFQKYKKQYTQGMFLPDRAYIFQSEGNLNILLRVRPHKSKTLETAIKAKKQGDNTLQKMQKLAETVHKLHQNGHCHGKIKLSNIICRKDGKVKLGIPDYSQIKKWRQGQDSSSQQASQVSDKAGFHAKSDLFSLGFVFLQLMIGQVLPQSLPFSGLLFKLHLVEDQYIQKLIRLMLKEQIDILEIPRILDNPKDNLAPFIPKEQEAEKRIEQSRQLVFEAIKQPKMNPVIQHIEQMAVNVALPVLQAQRKNNIVYYTIPDFNNVYRMIGKQNEERVGLIITDQIILTVCLLDQMIEMPGLSIDIETYQGEWMQDQFGLKYNVVCVNFHDMRLDVPYFLKFVKNYSEQLIKQNVQLQNKVTFTYQLGKNNLFQGDIIFHQDSFELKNFDIDRRQICSGQPLRVIFSTNCRVVIGMHVKNGKGFLINEKFQVEILFNILSKWRSQQSLLKEIPPFVFVGCDPLGIIEGEIRNLNDSAIERYLETNSIKDSETAQAIFLFLDNYSDVGFYHYFIGSFFYKSEPQLILAHLLQAIKCFSNTNDRFNQCYASIQYSNLSIEFKLINIQAMEDQQLRNFRNLYTHTIGKLSGINYFFTLSIMLSLIKITKSNTEKLKILGQAQALCKLLNLCSHQSKINALILEIQQIILIGDSPDLSRPFEQSASSDYFASRMSSIKEYITINRFDLVNNQLHKLFSLFGRYIRQNKEKEDEFVNLWKMAYIKFIACCQNRAELSIFEDFSRIHVKDCYYHARKSFWEKDKLIIKNFLRQLSP